MLLRGEFQEIDLRLYCRGDNENGACSQAGSNSRLK
jgi:hypothetical protein